MTDALPHAGLPDPDELAARWPAPEPDEPESLRQDILDELGDHLQSAYDHELIKTGDSQSAASRVLNRFGDPVELANRLFREARQGVVMRQTVWIVVSAVSTTLSVAALGGLAWFAMAWQGANLRLEELQRELAASAQQQQAERDALRRELLLHLESRKAEPSSTSSYLPLKLRIVGETTRKVVQTPVDFHFIPPLPAPVQTPAPGASDVVYDFGLVPPGIYKMSFQSNAENPWRGGQEFWVRPGNPEILEVSYPDAGVTKPGRLKVDFGVPEDLRDAGLEQLRFGIPLGGVSYQSQGRSWGHGLTLPGMPASQGDAFGRLLVVVDGTGRVIEAMGCNEGSDSKGGLFHCKHRCPAQDAAAMLLGGRYSVGNWLFLLPAGISEQPRFRAVEILRGSQSISEEPLIISSEKSAVLVLSDSIREQLWKWMRWSGVLPLKSKVTQSLEKVRVDGAIWRAWGSQLPNSLRPEAGDETLGGLGPMVNDQPETPRGTLTESNATVWLVIQPSKQSDDQVPEDVASLTVGLVQAERIDGQKKTITLRVSATQQHLLERLMETDEYRLQLRAVGGGVKPGDMLLPESQQDALAEVMDELARAGKPTSLLTVPSRTE